jgi:hypothetical protein
MYCRLCVVPAGLELSVCERWMIGRVGIMLRSESKRSPMRNVGGRSRITIPFLIAESKTLATNL